MTRARVSLASVVVLVVLAGQAFGQTSIPLAPAYHAGQKKNGEQIPLPPPQPVSSKYIHSPERPLTHYEFARVFRPMPGEHHVCLIHPGLCKKVKHVCFRLPPGCPRVCVGKRYLKFDYGHCCVEIRFRLFGRVTVEYR